MSLLKNAFSILFYYGARIQDVRVFVYIFTWPINVVSLDIKDLSFLTDMYNCFFLTSE
jgi:hypothetical protein